jgi:Gpi18-like mannosyltransferase
MKRLISIVKSLNDFKKILLLFIFWRLVVFGVAYLATLIIPVWGGWYPYVDRVLSITGLPSWIWGFGGFDGVHYLRIAQNGYTQGSQAFFPAYPILINLLSRLIPVKNYFETALFVNTNFFYAGMILSNVFTVLGLWVTKKLFDLEYDRKISWSAIVLLLALPTSFYYGAIYTESMFLLFAAATLYFYKKGNYLLAAIFGIVTSATKIVGVIIPGILIIDAIIGFWKKSKVKENIKVLLAGLTGSMGLFGYMAYLQIRFGDALLFLNSQASFGAGRSDKPFILLPQVIYRYFKILTSIPPSEMKFYNALFEIVFSLLGFVFLFWGIKKIRPSYWLAIFGMLIIPTLTGTFLSMPRFILTVFLLLPFVVIRLKKAYTPVVIALIILGVICISLFTRGYWVA